MVKRIIFTGIGIALSFAIAIGGWVLISRLIDINSDSLMSATGVMPIAMPISLPPQDDPQSDLIYVQPLLTEQEIVSILQNLESPGRTRPHEPTGGQIDLQQALEIGEEWMRFMALELNLPDELLVFENAVAYLSQNQLRNGDAFLPPAYSFWSISYSNNFIEMQLLINAVEGQVWRSDLTLISGRPWFYVTGEPNPPLFNDEQHIRLGWFFADVGIEDISETLATFASKIGLDAAETRFNIVENWRSPHTDSDGLRNVRLYRMFANGAAYAAVHVRGRPHYGVDMWNVFEFSLYLGVSQEVIFEEVISRGR